MSEPLSERLLADAIRENVGCDILCADLCTCKIAAAVAHERLVADRLALTEQIKALLDDETRLKRYWIGGLTQYTAAVSIDDLREQLRRLPGLAPTSEQPE